MDLVGLWSHTVYLFIHMGGKEREGGLGSFFFFGFAVLSMELDRHGRRFGIVISGISLCISTSIDVLSTIYLFESFSLFYVCAKWVVIPLLLRDIFAVHKP